MGFDEVVGVDLDQVGAANRRLVRRVGNQVADQDAGCNDGDATSANRQPCARRAPDKVVLGNMTTCSRRRTSTPNCLPVVVVQGMVEGS